MPQKPVNCCLGLGEVDSDRVIVASQVVAALAIRGAAF